MPYSQNICRYPLVILVIAASFARNPNSSAQPKGRPSLLVSPVAVFSDFVAPLRLDKYARDFREREPEHSVSLPDCTARALGNRQFKITKHRDQFTIATQ